MTIYIIVLCLLLVAIPATASRCLPFLSRKFPRITPLITRTTSIAPLIIVVEGYLSNWGSGFISTAIGFYDGVLANHIVDMLAYTLATIFISRYTKATFLFWVYFVLTVHHFFYVTDYWNNGGEVLYATRKEFVLVIQMLIVAGLFWDGASGGKRNAARRYRGASVYNPVNFSYNGGIRSIQAKTIR